MLIGRFHEYIGLLLFLFNAGQLLFFFFFFLLTSMGLVIDVTQKEVVSDSVLLVPNLELSSLVLSEGRKIQTAMSFQPGLD